MYEWVVDFTAAGKEREVVRVWVLFCFVPYIALAFPYVIVPGRVASSLAELVDDDALLAALLDAVAGEDVDDENLLVLPFLEILHKLLS